MHITSQELPLVQLAEGEDLDYGRDVEAGLYAEHLLATDPAGWDPALLALAVERGRHAAAQLWWVGIRMALQASHRHAARSGLPRDELFQDACLAVAEAIRRYDYTRGNRFTTLVHGYVAHALNESSGYRIGHAAASRADRRAAKLVTDERERMAARGGPAGLESVARALGVTSSSVVRGLTRVVCLDEAIAADPGALAMIDEVEGEGLGFLDLLNERQRTVLNLRFGLTGEPHTFRAAAARLGTTASTVKRWEREAIQAAQAMLAQERTTANCSP